jgi:hypothetical protein
MRTLTLAFFALSASPAMALSFSSASKVTCPPGATPIQCAGGIILGIQPELDDDIHPAFWRWAASELPTSAAAFYGATTDFQGVPVSAALLRDSSGLTTQVLLAGAGDFDRDGVEDDLIFGLIELRRSNTYLVGEAFLDLNSDGATDRTLAFAGTGLTGQSLGSPTSWTLTSGSWGWERANLVRVGGAVGFDTFTPALAGAILTEAPF